LDALEGSALGELLASDGLDGVTAAVRAAIGRPVGGVDIQQGLDGCIDIIREVYRTGSEHAGLAMLALAVVELWAYHDHTGDRRRVRRILLVVEILLDVGLPPDIFNELVELLRLGWDPFLTDAAVELGLDAIELLAAHQADASAALESFARPLLARIGPHNARRLPQAALEVAAHLAAEFGLGLEVPRPERPAGEDHPASWRVTEGTVVALYSLMETAAERAAVILRRRHPGLVVVTLAEHVASDRLRGAARTADLVVVMDRAAKHAATDALRMARGHRPLRYAAGQGSTSLITATEDGLNEIAAWALA
jgi:hypothetical protein